MEIDAQRPGLKLRSWGSSDVASLVEQANDRAVWRNLAATFPHPYTQADGESWISIAAQCAPSLHLCIEFEGAVAGGIGIIAGSGIEAKTGQFGYWLGQKFWGRGIATDAARTLVRFARSSLNLVRLQAPVFEWNPASMRVLEKVGFRREAVMRKSVFKDGQIIDSVMFALMLDEAS